jgi:hypothetical protein
MKLRLRTLVLIVVLVVAAGFVVANRLGGTSTGGTATAVTDSTSPSGPAAEPEAGHTADDGHDHAGDDGTEDEPPVMVKPTEQPDVEEAAAQFAAAWLNAFGQSPQQWRDGLKPRMTDDLAVEMAEADPQSVPAAAKVGAVTATVQGSLNGADVKVVSDAAKPEEVGTLSLTLLDRGGRWLVSEIDWAAAK